MKVSASIEIVMQLAAQEAIAAQFKEIEPEHLLAAILKLSELPVEEVDKIAPGANAAKDLAIEVNTLRERLAEQSVDSTRMRRRLREQLGNGQSRYDGGVMHRAQASRIIFDVAARMADDTGSDTLTAMHLLEAIMASPTPMMAKVLVEIAPAGWAANLAPRAHKGMNTPVLDEVGRDLVKLAANEPLPDATKYKAECKALIEVLVQRNRRGIVLVASWEMAAHGVVDALAHVMGTKDCPKDLRGKRLVDITTVYPDDESAMRAQERLERLVAEVQAAKNVILYMSTVSFGLNCSKWWLQMLRPMLVESQVQFICWITAEDFLEAANDPFWRKHAHILRVHGEKYDEFPNEL